MNKAFCISNILNANMTISFKWTVKNVKYLIIIILHITFSELSKTVMVLW